MSAAVEPVARMRCPVCFSREIDVLLLHRAGRYYCVKCSYQGDVNEVRAAYARIREKYKNRTTRIPFEQIESL